MTLAERLESLAAALLAAANDLAAEVATLTHEEDQCSRCRGRGKIRIQSHDNAGPFWTTMTCPTCHGNGVHVRKEVSEEDGATYYVPLYDATCPECNGRGRHDCTGPDGWTSVRCPDCRGTGKRARSMSDLDILVRSDERTRCPSCGGQTGSYDGDGQWYECGLCEGTGYRKGVVR